MHHGKVNKAALVREETLLLFQHLRIRRGRRVSMKFVEECMEMALAERRINFDPAYMKASLLTAQSPFAMNADTIWMEVNPKAVGFDGKGWIRTGKGLYERKA